MVKTRKVYRDSRTGQWTEKKNIKLRPDTTETERRPVPKHRKGRK
jgi:hypothetical protein